MTIPNPRVFITELMGRELEIKKEYVIDPEKVNNLEDMQRLLPLFIEKADKVFKDSEIEGMEHLFQVTDINSLQYLMRVQRDARRIAEQAYFGGWGSIGVF